VKNLQKEKLEAVVNLNNRALATGNYRKFILREIKNCLTSLILNGLPCLLSTTVIADDGITADAYATAFMVMGLKNRLDFKKTKT
jgi:thiamine biosynthesis lipoprotein